MRVLYHFAHPPVSGAVVGVLSTFDGVDAFDRTLLAQAHRRARADHALSAAFVIWPGIEAMSKSEATPSLLMTLDERLDELARLGIVDVAYVLPPAATIDDTLDLLEHLAPPPLALLIRTDVASQRPTASAGSSGEPSQSRQANGIEFVTPDDTQVPSRIRAALTSGDIETVTHLLGHPYTVSGQVIHGDQRGRELGFPTANLSPDARKLLPRNGIYAVLVRLPGEPVAQHPAAASIGVRPTFGESNRLLTEVFLLDATIDLYGLPLTVEFIARLRDELRFSSIDSLTEQMRLDVARCREILRDYTNVTRHGSESAAQGSAG